MNGGGPVPGQFVVGAAVIAFAFLFSLAVALLIVIGDRVTCWIRRRSADRHDVGPDALRLLEELDKHLDGFALDDPEVQAGLARLRAAVRDEQQGGAL